MAVNALDISWWIADWMNQHEYTYKGRKFTATAIRRILDNTFYVGVTPWGKTSKELQALRLIEDETFTAVQEIRNQRMRENEEARTLAMTMKGRAMLGGNIYCKHCGHRMVSILYREKYTRKDGTVVQEEYPKYYCYHNGRKLCECDGQATYRAEWIDRAVETMVRKLFEAFGEVEKQEQIRQIVENRLSENQTKEKVLRLRIEKNEGQIHELRKEIGKSLVGDSIYEKEDLAEAVKELRRRVDEDNQTLRELQSVKSDKMRLMEEFIPTLEKVRNWANEFETACLEQKKMICCNLFKRIEMGKGYEVNVVLNTTYEDFFQQWGGDKWKEVTEEGEAKIS